METKYEVKELSGSLWKESNCEVIRKGTIKINGETKYASILKYTHNDGSEKYELVFSAGLLYVNNDKDKLKDTTPDIGGPITYNDKVYKFGAWKNVTDSGTPYLSVNLKPKEDEKPVASDPNDIDKLPF